MTLFLLLLTGTLMVMAGTAIAPILPDLVTYFQLDRGVAGYLVSLHYLTIAVFCLPLGLLADRVGAVPVLIVSLLCYGVAGVTGGLAPNFTFLLVTRGFLGVASGGIAAASLGLIGRLYPPGEKRTQAIAYVATAISLANVIYPILGGLLGAFNWRAVFLLYGVAFPLAFVVWLGLGKEAKGGGGVISFDAASSQVSLWQNPILWMVLGTVALTLAIAYSIIIYLPLYLRDLFPQIPPLSIGLILATQAIGSSLIAAFAVKSLNQKLGSLVTGAFGFGAIVFSLMILPQLQQITGFFGNMFLLGMGLGAVLPSLYNTLANLAPPQAQATVLAAGTGIGYLGQFFAPTLLGWIVTPTQITPVFYLGSGLGLLLGINLFILAKVQAKMSV